LTASCTSLSWYDLEKNKKKEQGEIRRRGENEKEKDYRMVLRKSVVAACSSAVLLLGRWKALSRSGVLTG